MYCTTIIKMNITSSAIIILFLVSGIEPATRKTESTRSRKPTTEKPTPKPSEPQEIMSWKEFKDSLIQNQYPEPTREKYDTVIRLARQFGIDTRQELAMFLAQVYWESVGLQHTKEIACAKSSCPTNYRTGREEPGKYYYGRGYIQLTWLDNYENCSLDLYGDMRLVENPDLVSDTEEGAWGSAFWYWDKYVHDIPEIHDGEFGHTTMAINGPLECRGPYKVKAFKRYVIYSKIYNVWNLRKARVPEPKQDGCYPMDGPEAPGFHLCRPIGFYKNSAGMYHWCNDNCNSIPDPNCPANMCECEGGVPKAQTEASPSSSSPKSDLRAKR